MSFEAAMRAEVRWAIGAAGISQSALAHRAGISQTHVSRILTGRAGMSPGMYERLLDVCGRRPVAATVAL